MEKRSKRIISFGLLFILVLIIVFIIIFWKDNLTQTGSATVSPSPTTPATQIPPATETPNTKYSVFPRDAFSNASDTIIWNNTIGGSGIDMARAVFYNDNITIFGETNSNDNDFTGEGERLYCAKLNKNGSLLSTFTFGGNCGEIVLYTQFVDSNSDALIFVLISKTESSTFLHLIKHGENSAITKTLSNINPKAIYNRINGFTVIAEQNNGQNTVLKIYNYGTTASQQCEATISEANCNILYAKAILIENSLCVLANVDTKTTDYFKIVQFEVASQTITKKQIYDATTLASTGVDIAPMQNGGYIVLDKEQNKEKTRIGFIIINSKFDEILPKKYAITSPNIISAQIIPRQVFDEENKIYVIPGYYIIANSDTDSSCKYFTSEGIFDKNIDDLKNIGNINKFIQISNYAVILSTRSSTVNTRSIIITILNENQQQCFTSKFGGELTDCGVDITKTENGFIVVGNVTSKHNDISLKFGNFDSWLFKFNPNI